jgi:cytochrome c biogenesis factor
VQVDIYVNGKLAHEARPAIDYYYKNEQTIRHPYIHTIQLIDIYLIYEYSTGSSATFTFKTIPHVNLIWAGTVLGILGVMVAAWPRKLSILKGGVR